MIRPSAVDTPTGGARPRRCGLRSSSARPGTGRERAQDRYTLHSARNAKPNTAAATGQRKPPAAPQRHHATGTRHALYQLV